MVLGLHEYEQSAKAEQARDFESSEMYLKEALKILKNSGQEKSLGYLFLLKRLGYVSFMGKKYSDSEKYFKVTANMMPMVTKNPANLFVAQKNLLTLYTHINLDKADEQAKRMTKDSEDLEFMPKHLRELSLMRANLHLLRSEYKMAKSLYRNVLQLHTSADIGA